MHTFGRSETKRSGECVKRICGNGHNVYESLGQCHNSTTQSFKDIKVGMMMDPSFLANVTSPRNCQADRILNGLLNEELGPEFGTAETFHNTGIEYGHLKYSICFEPLYGHCRIYYP